MPSFLDETWFDRYQAIVSRVGETYELLLPRTETLEEKLRDFTASDFTMNISLYPDRANVSVLQAAREDLERLRQDVVNTESDELVRDAYSNAITNLEWNAAMIIAATKVDDEEFKKANDALYDHPNEEIFKAVCHWIRHDTETTLKTAHADLAKLADAVLQVIPDLYDNHQMLIPTEKVFHTVRQMHRKSNGYYDKLFGIDGMPNIPYIDDHLGDQICAKALQSIGSDFVMAPSNNTIWAVFPSRKQVVRPAGYRLDRDEFIGIVCHEIGSHVLEQVNGEKQKLKLLALGLAGYEKGNEGRAFLREQIVYENERTFLKQFAWEYIVLLHLSVSLASGIHRRPYAFVELYNVLYVLYRFWRERRLPLSTNNELFARSEAWQLAVRVMKGTDGNGGAYMKDSVYLEGNIRCWQLALHDPSLILLGDQGKFDLTNPTHLRIIHSLGY
jgi:hypothetical protein